MGKFNWSEIQLYLDAVKGIEAMEKLTNEKPFISLSKRGQELWGQIAKNTEAFYKLDIQERLYESGMSTRPTTNPIKAEETK